MVWVDTCSKGYNKYEMLFEKYEKDVLLEK